MVEIISFLIGCLYAFAAYRLTKPKQYAITALIVTEIALASDRICGIPPSVGLGGMLAMIVGSIFVLLNPSNATARRIGGGMLIFAALALAGVIVEGWEVLTWFPRYGGLTSAALMVVGGIVSIVLDGRSR